MSDDCICNNMIGGNNMKSVLGILIILLVMLTISCDDSQFTEVNVDEENVNFMISSYHFVINIYS
jgi:hypothetical protein